MGGEILQIATSAETTVNTLMEKLLSILMEHGVDKARVKNAEPRQGDVRRNFSDTSKARKLLGWEAKVELERGLNRTVKWFTETMTV